MSKYRFVRILSIPGSSYIVFASIDSSFTQLRYIGTYGSIQEATFSADSFKPSDKSPDSAPQAEVPETPEI